MVYREAVELRQRRRRHHNVTADVKRIVEKSG